MSPLLVTVRAVVATQDKQQTKKKESKMEYKDWMKENLSRDDLNDIVKHGCGGGIPGLIYHSELHDLYVIYESYLWATLEQMALDIGERGAIGLIANCAPSIGSQAGLEDFVVLAATEYLAQSVLDDMPRWVLCHLGSGHIEYFDTEEEAEAERKSCYIEEKEEDRGTYEEYCEWWIVEQEKL